MTPALRQFADELRSRNGLGGEHEHHGHDNRGVAECLNRSKVMTDTTTDIPSTAEVMRLGRIHSFAELGEMCGVTRQTARKWETIPEDHCPAIERITGLTAEVMRPDVEWRRDRKDHRRPDARRIPSR